MAWGAAAAIGAAAIGAAVSSSLNSAEASKTRRWAREMRSTAYQATMKDMKKAGLNPILVSRQGPSQAPQGAMAKIPDMGATAAQATQAATKAYKAKPEMDLMQAQAANQNAASGAAVTQSGVNMAKTQELMSQEDLNRAATLRETASARELAAKASILEGQRPSKVTSKWEKGPYGTVLREIERVRDAVGLGPNTAQGVRGAVRGPERKRRRK